MEIDKLPFNCYKCYVCTYRTPSFSLLNDHLNAHARTFQSNDLFYCESASLEAYKCIYCNYESDLKVLLHEHVEEAHRGKAPNCFSEYLMKIFTCKTCSFKTHCLLVFAAHTHRQKKHRTKQSSNMHKRKNYVGGESEKINDSGTERTINRQSERNSEDGFQNSFSDEGKSIVEGELEIKWFKCEQCPYETKLRRKLQNHMLHKHANQVNTECLTSAQRSYQSGLTDNVKVHAVIQHEEPEVHVVTQHEELESDIQYYQCQQCSYRATNKFFLTQHVIRKHTDLKDIKWFKCAQCSYQSKAKNHLRQHIQNRHTHPDFIEWHQCSRCWRKFKQKRSLREHTLREHPNPDETIRWFKCSQCSYQSKIRDYLVQHIQRMHLVSSDKCVKWYHCEQCSHKTKKKSNLKSHILCKHTVRDRVNINKKNCFQCTLCSYKSNEKRYLKQHVRRTHDGMKWHQCVRCSYKATKKLYLRNHILCQHPEERIEYQEEKKSSESSAHRTNTLREPVMEDWFKCAECPYQSRTKRYFRQHQYRVHGNIWHRCELCPYKVKKKCYLTNHILRQHTNPEEIQTEVQNK